MEDRTAPTLHLEIEPRVTFAAHQNDVPLVKRLAVENRSDRPIQDLRLTIVTSPAVSDPWEHRLEQVPPGARVEVPHVDLRLLPDVLRQQTERERGRLELAALSGEERLAGQSLDIEILAPTEWPGLGGLPELLAAWVTPNDPSLAPVLKAASRLLEEQTGDSSLSGYQQRDPGRVAHVAQAIYRAVQARGLSYINPPASFEERGQKIRLPERVLREEMATCLDITVLMASLLEQAGLNPLLVLVEGHAFPALWLTRDSFPTALVDSPVPIRKRMKLDEILAWDSSALAQGLPFSRARSAAVEAMDAPDRFVCALDVKSARQARILPLSLSAGGEAPASAPSSPGEAEGQAPLEDLSISPDQAPEERTASTAPSRLDRWKRKLLDLSLRNRLLNFKEGKKSVPLLVPSPDALEDGLAGDRGFGILPRPHMMEAGDVRDHELHRLRTGLDPVNEYLGEALGSGRLHAPYPPAELERRLLELYRESRSSVQESGAVTLYLALGFLRWYESPSSRQPRYAPLVMVPVTLERGRGSQPYRLTRADDETRVNVTLLHKLQADYGIDPAGLDDPPTDEAGLDVKQILRRFQRLVLHQDRWEILNSCFIARFSFTKFLVWLDLEARTDELLENEFVRHIFEGEGSPFPMVGPPVGPERIDERPAAEVLSVMDADPSQLSAIFAAEEGSSFVLQGAPGTGKSQTITNLVAQLLSRGKTVLFVSEKLAALQVVHRRLTQVGLGPFCLEVHSHAASKRAVIEQIKRSFELRPKPGDGGWEEHCRQLEETRGCLDEYAALLREEGPMGMSLHEAGARLIGLRDAPRLELGAAAMEGMDPGRYRSQRAVARELCRLALELGELPSHPWRGARARRWDPRWQGEVEAALGTAAGAARAMEEAASELGRLLGLDAPPLGGSGPERLARVARGLMESPRPPAALLTHPSPSAWGPEVDGWLSHLERRRALWTDLSTRFQAALLSMDLRPLQARFARWAGAFFLLAFFFLWGARRKLAAVATASLPPNRRLAVDLDSAVEVTEEDAVLSSFDAKARGWLGEHWRGEATDPERLKAVLAWIAEYRQACLDLVGDSMDPAGFQRLVELATGGAALISEGSPGEKVLRKYVEAASAWSAARGHLQEILELEPELAWGPGAPWRAQVAALEKWKAEIHRLRGWCALQRVRADGGALGLLPLADAVEAGKIPPEQAEDAVQRSVLHQWWSGQVSEDDRLAAFRGADHEALISRFQALDTESLRLAREVLRTRLAARMPDLYAPGDEAALLRQQLKLSQRHMPVRRLFTRIPTTLRRLKPCFLMSPLSVAQYLDPSLEHFDVVVFDEASQIPPWDAVGAIARGRQVIVVGDSKQLPPTSFFSRGGEDEDADDEDIQEMESILDEAVSAGLRELPLKWHYRSRHESLIAFSNHKYYGGRLHTFPSAVTDPEEAGVQLVAVPEGCYDRSGSRTNRGEAEAVVEEMLRLLRQPEDIRPTVGVVTFSMAQQRLIEDLVDAARLAHPELDPCFSDGALEPVFVKNLENVQGDERDVMLFSICYGPDRTGRVSLNFGPLNRKGGERRLNVAVTRARQRTVIFSTLTADQIDLRRTSAVGVAHLKTYLEYAEKGMVALDAVLSVSGGATTESPFETQVKARLEELGWEVQPQVGCSGYRVDLGVVDPDRPGRFILGVECDGATYHGSACARERDRLRQGVLENLGWRLHRIWSTDWWLEPDREMTRLVDALEEARREARRDAPVRPVKVTSTLPPPPPTAEPEVRFADLLAGGPQGPDHPEDADEYPACEAPLLGEPGDFYLPEHLRDVGRRLGEVVDLLGPVHRDDAARIVIASWGMSRLGSRIRSNLEDALATCPPDTRPRAVGDWLWPARLDPATWRGVRIRGADPASHRDIDQIPPEEIANAAEWVLHRAFSISREDLARNTARVFGITQLRRKVKAALDRGLELLLETGRASRRADDDRFQVPDPKEPVSA